MDSASLLKLIKDATEILYNTKYRPKDKKANPGSLFYVPKDKTPIIIGDLHAAKDNLVAIIEHEENLNNLKQNKAFLIIVGDALHNDQTGYMLEMNSSLETLEVLLKYITLFPDNIVYIRGNHDTFDERLRKSGIAQGEEFRKFLLNKTDSKVVEALSLFFERLPMFVIGNGFVVTHAGPVRGGLTTEELINVYYDTNAYMQLMWNRIHEFRGNPNLKEYGENDIKAMLKKLELPENTHFIVGHNPMWNTGELSGVWMNVLGIRNHHIIYSNLQTNAPYLTYNGGEIIKKFAIKPPPEKLYV